MRSRTLASALVGAAISCAIVATPEMARANGRIPASSYLAFSPSDANTIVMRTTFGLLVTHDAGQHWDWVCEAAIGYTGTEDPAIAVFQTGSIMASTTSGLAISPDTGCAWGLVGGPLAKLFFADNTIRRNDPKTGFAISSGYAGGEDDAGNLLFNSDLFTSGDNGTTWSQVGPALDPEILVETLDVAQSDPLRFYVSAIRGSGTNAEGLLLVSIDGGQTWIERQIPLIPAADGGDGERAPYIAGIDPTNADRVYVRTGATPTDPSRLLVSDDAGQTWNAKFTTSTAMLGFALSLDGSKVWLGSVTDGVQEASTTDFVFTKKSNVQVQCLAVRAEGELWACSNEATGFVAGVSHDDGATFTGLLHLSQVRGPLACPPASPTNVQCTPLWPAERDQLGAGGADAGPEAGVDAATAPPTKSSSCSCDVPGDAPWATGAVVTGAFAFLFAARRRRRTARN